MENTQRYALLPQVLLPWYKKTLGRYPGEKIQTPITFGYRKSCYSRLE